jgi:sec-independent protein translocase protein TatC
VLAAALALARLRPVRHDEQLSVVGHLDELRTRLLVSFAVLAAAFGLCFWQNHRLLALIDAPLAHQTQAQVVAGHGPLGATYRVQRETRDIARQLDRVVGVLSAQQRAPRAQAELLDVSAALRRDIRAASAAPHGDRPVTLGIGEPFTTTLTVSLAFALVLAMPVLLWQLYAYLMPAFDPVTGRRLRPLVLAAPVLFLIGVGFGYLVVLPAAVRFFQNFNSGQFNVLVQAGQYYKFASTTILAMGVLFEVPVAILAATRAGLVTPAQLRHGRRYAVAACAAVAALLPGDVVTMLLETVPLYVLFEAGVLVAGFAERRARS